MTIKTKGYRTTLMACGAIEIIVRAKLGVSQVSLLVLLIFVF